MSGQNRVHSSSSWNLATLLSTARVRVKNVDAARAIEISGLADDSRKVKAGDCFVAVRGTASDGHSRIPDAVQAGAAAVIAEDSSLAPDGAAVFCVDDTRAALAHMASAYYGMLGDGDAPMKLIGITGTNGKTTVAWMLRSIIRSAGASASVLGTLEYDLVSSRERAPLTTPGALKLCGSLRQAYEAGARYGVLEVSSHALDQKRTDGLSFAAGVFTNLSGDHLDYHCTMENYCAAKQRLFERLGEDAVAVVSSDDPIGERMARSTAARVVRYGMECGSADLRGTIISSDIHGTIFEIDEDGAKRKLRLPVAGRHNVLNALAAYATARAVGLEAQPVCDGLEQVTEIPGRLQRVNAGDAAADQPVVLVDYAHTDDALRSVLGVLRPITPGRLICVFGCGGDRDRSKRPRMAAAVGGVADVAYVTSDNPRSENPDDIIAEVLPGFEGLSGCRVEVDANRREAIRAAIRQAKQGDVVLIAGKGHEDYQLVGDRVLHFDDREVARECLSCTASCAEDAA